MQTVNKILVSFFACVVLFSCTPKGIAKRTYKKVDQIAPYSTLDSQRLAKRSASTFRPGAIVIKPGTIKPDIKKDSSVYYREKFNQALTEKQKALQAIQEKYKDSLTELAITATSSFNDGFDIGNKVGIADGKSQCPIPVICTPDTLYQETPEQAVQREADRLTAATKAQEAIEWKARYEVAKKQARNRLYALIGENFFLLLCLAIWIYVKFFTSKVPVKL